MLCILFFIFCSCTLPTRLHLDRQYSAKIPLFLVLLLALWWRNKNHKRSTAKRIKYAPLAQRDTSDRICMRELRMSRPVFYKLCARLRERGLLVDKLHVSVEEQLAMFLKIVGQYHTHSSVAIAMWR